MPEPPPGIPKPTDPAAPAAAGGNPLDQALQRWLLDGRNDPDQTLLRWLMEGRRDAAPSWVGPASGDGPVSGFDPVSVSLVADLKSAVAAAVPVGPRVESGEAAGSGAGVATGPLPDRVGSYRIERVAGVGGMGAVFEAVDTRLGRRVALKMLRPDGADEGSGQSRFAREAVVLAALNHPNIVPVYEVGEHEGRPYLVLEYIAGGSLARWVRGRVLSPREAARAVRDLSEAVGYAHAQGVVHRDLKPGNVLLKPLEESGDRPRPAPVVAALEGPGGDPALAGPPLSSYRLMVADFGLACWGGERAALTHAGHLLGTPSYMAPEQAVGNGLAVGPAADLYALGAILYELLTGHPPFRSDTVAGLLRQIQENEPVPPGVLQPGVDRDLETICLKCLEKDPRRRYASAGELELDLGRYLRHEPIQARPVRWPGRAYRWCRRNPLAAGLGALACGLLVALGVGGQVSAWSQARLRAQAEQRTQEARLSAAQALKAQRWADGQLRTTWPVIRDMLRQFQALGSTTDPRIRRLRRANYRRAYDWCRQQTAGWVEAPTWDAGQLQIARMQAWLGRALDLKDDHVTLLARVIREGERLRQLDPADPDVTRELAVACLLHSGERDHEQPGQVEAALADLDRADALFRELVPITPDDIVLWRNRYAAAANAAPLLRQLGRLDEAAERQRQSLTCLAEVLRIDPGNPETLLLVASQRRFLGRLMVQRRRWPEAESALTAALDCLDGLAPEDRQQPEAVDLRLRCLAFRAQAAAGLGQADRVVADVEAILALAPEEPLPSDLTVELIRSLYDLAAVAEAHRVLPTLVQDRRVRLEDAWKVLLEAARHTTAPTLPAAERVERTERVGLLLEALARRGGLEASPYREALRAAPEFATLRDCPEFQALLTRLAP